jgi:ABC-type hemin transport system ATPase subunit
MRIKKIQLKNGYKRFHDLTIDLGEQPQKIVALVGPNGSGKSSVFDGMLYLQNAYAQIGSSGQGDWHYHSMNEDAGFPDKRYENILITFDSGIFNSLVADRRKAGTMATLFSFRSPYRYSANLNVGGLQKLPDIKNNQAGASTTVAVDDKIIENYQRLYSLIDRLYKKEGAALTYEKAKEQVLGDLNRSLENVLSLKIHDHGDIVEGRGTLFFKKSDQANEFTFNVLSSGEKEVIDILVDIFVKKEHFKDSIFLIDEPELHINTSIQRKLLNEIVKIIPEKCQLWIATHSIGFLNALKQDHYNDASIIWFKGKLASESVVLKPMEKTRKNWKTIFATALEDLTGLLAPKRIIYCEGRKEPSREGEELGLDARAYNAIFEGEFPDTLFVSGGGATEPFLYSEIALKILGKAFDDVELLVLRDKDIKGDGAATSDLDREEWLRRNQSGRMLQRMEIENYLFDSEIIKKMNPHIDMADYAALITDVATQDLKKLSARIKALCGKDQMSKDNFKIALAEMITPGTQIYSELKSVIFNV